MVPQDRNKLRSIIPKSVPSTFHRVDLAPLLVRMAQNTNLSYLTKSDVRCLTSRVQPSIDAAITTGLESRDSIRVIHRLKDIMRWIDHLRFTRFRMRSRTLLLFTLPQQHTLPMHFSQTAPPPRALKVHLLLLKLLCRTRS